MSLQLAAKHLAAHGRGPDNTLVHMTPKEVESLQALAMRHGGSLTINPQTGLPEAGFLSSILPLVAGAGLTAMGMPASMAALTVGGGTAAVTGDLKKGLMAGMGAYGGSNLAASLIGSGMAPAAAAANAVPVETAASLAQAAPVPAEALPGLDTNPYMKAAPIEAVDPYKGMLKLTDAELADAAKHQQEVAARQARLGDHVEFIKRNQIDDVPKAFNTSRPNDVFPKPVKAVSLLSPEDNAKNIANFAPNAAPTYGPAAPGPEITDTGKRISFGPNASNVQPPEVAASQVPAPEMYTKGAYLPSPKEMTAGERFEALKAGATGKNLWNYAKENPFETAGMLYGPLMGAYEDYRDANKAPEIKGDSDRGAMANAGYQFDPGWANPTPRADPYGREQTYNRPRYYVPKKAADGGAVQHFDEGGMVARASQSPVLQQFIEDQATRAAQPAPAQVDVKQQFADYLKAQAAPLPNSNTAGGTTGATATPATPATAIEDLPQQGGTRGGLSMEQRDEMNDPNSWANQTDAQKTDYYANHPGMLGFSEGAQNLWSGSWLGQFQNHLDPSIQGRQSNINAAARMQMALQNSANTGANLEGGPGGLSTVRQNAYDTGRSGFQGSGAAPNSSTSPAAGTNNDANPGWGSRDAGGGEGGGLANGGGITALAQGGMYNLGSYSDGGRLLRGPGDGVSDSIPAVIGQKQPARLADGEFVIPARIVSEIGNGSTEAGARKLYAMMDRVQKSRGKTVGKGKVAKNTRADKYLPA